MNLFQVTDMHEARARYTSPQQKKNRGKKYCGRSRRGVIWETKVQPWKKLGGDLVFWRAIIKVVDFCSCRKEGKGGSPKTY